MTNLQAKLVFEDQAAVADLEQFLSRAKRLDKDGAVRLKSYGDIVTATVAPIYGNSILGSDPTVLGIRVSRLRETSDVDVVVSLSAVLERLASKTQELQIPPVREVVAWAGVSAPQTGWEKVGELSATELSVVAETGIAEVAQAIPGNLGASLVQKVRSDVWGRKFGELQLPAGVCFALSGLGFLVSDAPVEVFRNANWRRLTTAFGHVVTKAS